MMNWRCPTALLTAPPQTSNGTTACAPFPLTSSPRSLISTCISFPVMPSDAFESSSFVKWQRN